MFNCTQISLIFSRHLSVKLQYMVLFVLLLAQYFEGALLKKMQRMLSTKFKGSLETVASDPQHLSGTHMPCNPGKCKHTFPIITSETEKIFYLWM